MKFHPDRNPDVKNNPELREKFTRICEAYEVLGNVEKRADYDALNKFQHGQSTVDWHQGFGPPPGTYYTGNTGSARMDWRSRVDSIFEQYQKDDRFRPPIEKTQAMLDAEEQEAQYRKTQRRVFFGLFIGYLTMVGIKNTISNVKEQRGNVIRNVLIYDEETGTYRRQNEIGKPLDTTPVAYTRGRS